MEYTIKTLVKAVLILLLVAIFFGFIMYLTGNLKIINKLTTEYCNIGGNKISMDEFSEQLEVKIKSGEGRDYYVYYASNECFEDPDDIKLDEGVKSDFFCDGKEGKDFGVEKAQKKIDKYCKVING